MAPAIQSSGRTTEPKVHRQRKRKLTTLSLLFLTGSTFALLSGKLRGCIPAAAA